MIPNSSLPSNGIFFVSTIIDSSCTCILFSSQCAFVKYWKFSD
nr:MAG TPA: hypothetical protein [Caudoviricetes sp.]DAT99349.1 MAG TPA: hypothetical protein [Caudoviricetes sp.]